MKKILMFQLCNYICIECSCDNALLSEKFQSAMENRNGLKSFLNFLKFPEISLADSYFLSCPIILNFSQGTAVLCAKFQNDWRTEIDVMDEKVSSNYKVKKRLRWTDCVLWYSSFESLKLVHSKWNSLSWHYYEAETKSCIILCGLYNCRWIKILLKF